MGNKNRAEKKTGGKLSSVLLVIFLLVAGLFFLIYPPLADYINTSDNRKTIGGYRDSVEEMAPEDYGDILAAAEEYNANLFLQSPFIAELTEEKREEYKSLLDVSGTGVIGYVEIDKIHVYLPIYHGTGNDILQKAIGHLEGSSFPVEGESVHAVISGHTGLPSARLFTDIDQLKVGDTFVVHVLNETLTYEIETVRKVLPDELQDLQIEEGRELCTLMTCTPYGVNSHRLVLTGFRIETPEQEKPEVGEKPSIPIAAQWDYTQLIPPIIIITAAVFFIPTSLILVKRRMRSLSGKEKDL